LSSAENLRINVEEYQSHIHATAEATTQLSKHQLRLWASKPKPK